MEKQYIIKGYELAACYYADCLDVAGVDNWSGYMINKKEYLGKFKSFRDKAKDALKYYEVFTKEKESE